MHDCCDRPSDRLWAYAYLLVPPQSGALLIELQHALNDENAARDPHGNEWNGRIVPSPDATSILVVTSHAGQARPVNAVLSGILQHSHTTYELTTPMAIDNRPATAAPRPNVASLA